MKNSITILLPDFIIEAFPVLKDATYIREFASLITLYPDAQYYLFQTSPERSFVLVAIDYPDPFDESRQLKKLSGGYKIEFTHLIKPYANNKHLKIHAGPDMDELFFVDDPKSYCHYYLAEVKMAVDW